MNKFFIEGFEKKSSTYISFPTNEMDYLKKRLDAGKPIYTTRVSQEAYRYKEGVSYRHPVLGELAVVSINRFRGVENHPFIDELTEAQKHELGKYRKQALVKLERLPE
jgi:hypothetical protein